MPQTQLETYITENEKRFLEDLKGWLRIPSISTLPEHAGDIHRAAEYAADQLRRIGFEQPYAGTTCTVVEPVMTRARLCSYLRRWSPL